MFDDCNRFIKWNMVPATGQTVAGRPGGPIWHTACSLPFGPAFRVIAFPQIKSPPVGGLFCNTRSGRYILSIIACPKPEHETCVAPGIRRAKS